MIDISDPIIGTFQDETTDSLNRLEEIALNISNNRDHFDPDDTRAILRILHTIKGNSGFIPIPPIVEIVTELETITKSLTHEEGVNEAYIDLLLSGLDFIRNLIENIVAADEANPSTLMHKLKSFISPSVQKQDAPAPIQEAPVVKPHPAPSFKNTPLKSTDRLVSGISLNNLRNRNEKRVLDLMSEMLPEYPEFDNCRVCIEDVFALTMNNVKPEYSPEGSIIFRYKVSKEEIKEQIINALSRVIKNPNH